MIRNGSFLVTFVGEVSGNRVDGCQIFENARRGEARRRFESPRKQAFINPKNLLEDLFKFLGFSVMSVTAVGDTNSKNIISAQKYGRSHLFNTIMVQKNQIQ